MVTIDAPYGVDVVQCPGGFFSYINLALWDESSPDFQAVLDVAYLAMETRVVDVSFVLGSLSDTTLANSLIPSLPLSGLSTTHTAMFGHSLGGATACSILESR